MVNVKNNPIHMAAKPKSKSTSTASNYHAKPKTKRPGVKAKTKNSRGKKCKNYVKAYRGQGR